MDDHIERLRASLRKAAERADRIAAGDHEGAVRLSGMTRAETMDYFSSIPVED